MGMKEDPVGNLQNYRSRKARPAVPVSGWPSALLLLCGGGGPMLDQAFDKLATKGSDVEIDKLCSAQWEALFSI